MACSAALLLVTHPWTSCTAASLCLAQCEPAVLPGHDEGVTSAVWVSVTSESCVVAAAVTGTVADQSASVLVSGASAAGGKKLPPAAIIGIVVVRICNPCPLVCCKYVSIGNEHLMQCSR